MTITGRVLVDITDAEPSRARSRLTCLVRLPAGVRVDVNVGPLAVNPEVARLLAEHSARLHIELLGTAHAVRRWLDAVEEPDILEWTTP